MTFLSMLGLTIIISVFVYYLYVLCDLLSVAEWAVKAFEEGILYFDALTPDTPPIELFIKTLEGTMHAPVGSCVIQGVRGEIYCCKEDIFLETYEPVLERE